jgi:predicted acyl esterase
MDVDLETTYPAPVPPAAEQVMVAMRDGVALATDVYRPDGPGPWPAVLVRLPYDKDGRYTFMPWLAPRCTARGYVFVVQDVRGKFRSEGETVPFTHETADGYDTIDWVSRQPWCSGAVGMFGDSYYGYTQWCAVASGHPALRAIVPRVTCADLGTWLRGPVDPLYAGTYLAQYWSSRHAHAWPVDFSRRPLAAVFDPGLAAIGHRSAGLDSLLEHARAGQPVALFADGEPFAQLRIPVLHAVGWFDNITPWSMRDYTRLSGDPDTAGRQYLIGNSTDHENFHLADAPAGADLDHEQSEAALERMLPQYVDPALDFFDAFLAGTRDPATLPRVRWHLGHDGWHESPRWPPPGATELRLYPADAPAATRDAAGGRLLPAPEGTRSAVTWTHDPQDLVPSTVADPFSFVHEFPDERVVQGRGDVLTFTTEPLDEALDLAGPVTVALTVATTGPSMHLFVKLADVAPDGRALMLLHGAATVAAGQGAEVPAELYLGHTGYRVRAGRRLRLAIAASDFPQYVPHPGTAESPWFATATQANQQTLVTGHGRSFVALTVLPSRDQGRDQARRALTESGD